ncbi:MAG: glutathione S-transferase [Rhodobacterales bacterium 65-51]|uniref:glutathione S-transferase family protein n=1 Tax=uncultured Gemmobacter sp. TaxID=1095917 RepID=UPI00096175DB|nr:glutathione S-transferase family protein [uncultured Gemmobacter sp.]OJY34840.1 MAG: glutathione S-transferase [Rhodobacterales bacterium 65-51]
MIELFGRPNSSNSAKVFWLLDQIGQDYRLVPAGRGFGPVDTPEFLALNPCGKVPVLREGDAVIWESNAILRYLARRFDAVSLLPSSAVGQAAVEGWMDWASITLTPPLTRLRKARSAGKTDDTDLPAVIAACTLLDRQLDGRDFIAGPSLTLADISAAPAVHRWFLLAGDKPALPRLAAYAERLGTFGGYVRHIRPQN